MTIINASHNFIFIHVPKSAGTTVTATLSPLTSFCDVEIGGTLHGEAIQDYYIKRFRIRKHSTASEIRGLVGDDFWCQAFSFAFVRNPYSRAYSFYTFLKNNDIGQTQSLVNDFSDFDEFLRSDFFASEGPDRLFSPQGLWTSGKDGQTMVDFVGHIETLEADLRYVRKKINPLIGVPDPPLGMLNASAPLDAWRGNISSEAQERIINRYGRDFDQFGYSRGLSSSSAPVSRPSQTTPVQRRGIAVRSAARLPARFELDLGTQILGEGWFGIDRSRDSRSRWTGPEPRFTFNIELSPAFDYICCIDALAARPEVAENVTVSVNGTAVAYEAVRTWERDLRLIFDIAGSKRNAEGEKYEVVIRHKCVHCPAEHGGSDKRKLGFAVRSISLTPRPQEISAPVSSAGERDQAVLDAAFARRGGGGTSDPALAASGAPAGTLAMRLRRELAKIGFADADSDPAMRLAGRKAAAAGAGERR